MRALWAAALALLTAAFIPGAFASSHASPTATASKLYYQAKRAVAAHDKRCASHNEPQPFVISHARPQAGLLDLLAPLRRPETAADRRALRNDTGLLVGDEREYVDYGRLARAADGHLFVVLAMRFPLHSGVPPAFCLRRIDSKLRTLLASQSRAAMYAATLMEQSIATFDHGALIDSRHDGAWLIPATFDGDAYGTSYPQIHSRGIFFLTGGYTGPNVIDGLVPDGIATVTIVVPPRIAWQGRTVRNKFTLERTLKVVNDVVRAQLSGRPFGFVCRVVWRDATGRMVRAFTTEMAAVAGLEPPGQ